MKYFFIFVILWLALIVSIKECSADTAYRINDHTVVIHQCVDNPSENKQKQVKLGDHTIIIYAVKCRKT